MVTWIVPTVTGREDGLERSIEPIKNREDVNIVIVRDKPTCGAAWVEGALTTQTLGDYVYFSADDIEPHEGFIEAMAEAVDRRLHPAALVLLPDGSKQSCGGAGQDVCRGDCADWAAVEWSPTPFIAASWWKLIEPHAEALGRLHYSTDRLVSAILAEHGIGSVVRRPAVITHYNATVGRIDTAFYDSGTFETYWQEHLRSNDG